MSYARLSSDSSSSDSDDSCHVQNSAVNEYEGYYPESGITHVTDRIFPDIKPTDFFDQYIKRRRPAVFSGLIKDSSFNDHEWTNSYLSTHAGDAKVLVEDRMGKKGLMSFGISSPKVGMKYDEFIKSIVTQETRYYLTTQDLERFVDDYDEFGLPKCIAAQPLSMLRDSYPLQPDILGNLVPHQVSLWQGCTGQGSGLSSGLHHDFHDNLYLLIRGHKRFRLFPPSAAEFLCVCGHLTKIHKNGLIVYASPPASQGQVSVRADGAPLSIIARHRQKEAERCLAEAEQQLEQLRRSISVENPEVQSQLQAAEKLVADCEEQMDSALEDILRYTEDEESHEDDNSCIFEEPAAKQPKTDSAATSSDDGSLQKQLPDHFCDVKLSSEDSDEWQTLFSQFEQPEKLGCMIVELHAGEMLYLPASWFHEVTSYDDSRSVTDSDVEGHLALNYWMYPPDGESFERPYKDDFWPQRWAKISSEKKCHSKLLKSDVRTTELSEIENS